MKFFVTYAGADAKWAEWIVWKVENSKTLHACIAQFRDFPPGPGFIDQIRAATEERWYNSLRFWRYWLGIAAYR